MPLLPVTPHPDDRFSLAPSPPNDKHKPPRRLRGKPLRQQARPQARFPAASTRRRRGRLDGVLGGGPGLPAPGLVILGLCPSSPSPRTRTTAFLSRRRRLTISISRRADCGENPFASKRPPKARFSAAGTRRRRGRLDGVLGGVPGLPAPGLVTLGLCPSSLSPRTRTTAFLSRRRRLTVGFSRAA